MPNLPVAIRKVVFAAVLALLVGVLFAGLSVLGTSPVRMSASPSSAPAKLDLASSPNEVSTALLSNIKSIGAGDKFTCALTQQGQVKCWGLNSSGQLGQGNNTNRVTPTDVRGLVSPVESLSVGDESVCAVQQNGKLSCWGDNLYGQLGIGTSGSYTYKTLPTEVPGLDGGVASVRTGYFRTCATLITGMTKCWGDNRYGALGDETEIDRLSPVSVTAESNNIVSIDHGKSATCVLTSFGAVECWGLNTGGQLGNGSNVSSLAAVRVVGYDSGVVQMGSGYNHSCAVSQSGEMRCWGINDMGRLGDGTYNNRSTPVTPVGLPSTVKRIALGTFSTCALLLNNEVYCWGWNDGGQLGVDLSSLGYSLTPVKIQGIEVGLSDIAMGDKHACVLTTSGEVMCWGTGGLGTGKDSSIVPEYVLAGEENANPTPTPTSSGVSTPTPQPSSTPTSVPSIAFSISGRVTVGGVGIAGVSVVAGTTKTTTDAQGRYTLAGLPEGNYAVTPALVDHTFDPASRCVTLPSSSEGIDFEAFAVFVKHEQDADGDAIPDAWETCGATIDPDGNGPFLPKFVDLPSIGADPLKPDIFIQLDWMFSQDYTYRISKDAIQMVVDSFASAPYTSPTGSVGINIHIDHGPDSTLHYAPSRTTWGDLSRARQITYASPFGSIDINNDYVWDDFDVRKNEAGGFTSSGRTPIFHYAISVDKTDPAGEWGGVSRDKPASDFVISLGIPPSTANIPRAQAITLMHELGHNLGLCHGGPSELAEPEGQCDENYKPNYLSIMNYLFIKGLVRSNPSLAVDYSRLRLDPLNESAIEEEKGIQPQTQGYGTNHACRVYDWWRVKWVWETREGQMAPLDLNCNNQIDNGLVKYNVNRDEGYDALLVSYEDWPHLVFAGGAISRFGLAYAPPLATEPEEEFPAEFWNEIHPTEQYKIYIPVLWK